MWVKKKSVSRKFILLSTDLLLLPALEFPYLGMGNDREYLAQISFPNPSYKRGIFVCISSKIVNFCSSSPDFEERGNCFAENLFGKYKMFDTQQIGAFLTVWLLLNAFQQNVLIEG